MARNIFAFRRWTACLLALAMLCLSPMLLSAEDPRTDTSLRFVPEDAAFYMSMLNNRKQVDALKSSNVFQSLANNPTVQLGLLQLQEMIENPEDEEFAQVIEFFQIPENREILEVLGDSVSHEIFAYGGGGYIEMLRKMQSMSNVIQQAQLDAAKEGLDPEAAVTQALAEQLKDLNHFPFGELVVGMKVKDTARAQRQLARLEELAMQAAANVPELEGKIAKEKVGDAELLTLTLDGNSVPWDEIPLDEMRNELGPEIVDDIIEKIKKSKLLLSIGMYDDYILFSFGKNNDHVANFGKGKLLIDRPELKGLKQANGRPLTSLTYVSEALVKSSQSVDAQLDTSAETLNQLVDTAGLPGDISDQIKGDVTDIFSDLKKFVPEPGAAFAFSFMTKDGYEAYGYSWTENIFLDGSKPLSILNHVGGDPIAFSASRTKGTADTYNLMKKMASRAIYYIDSFGVEEMDDESRQVYEVVREEALPLLRRFDAVTTDLLLPSIRDGQSAVVVDAQLLEKKWHEAMPEAEVALPFPEIGFVMGLSSADQFKQAVSEYIAIGRDAIDKLREVNPEEVPPVDVPPPMVRGYDFGDIYFYQIPPEAGLNKMIAPNAGISDDTLALSIIPRQTKRLLESKPPRVGNNLISMDKPLATATHFNFERLLNAIEPWVYYAVEEGSKQDFEEQLEELEGLSEEFGGDLGLGGGDFEAAPEFEIPGDFEDADEEGDGEGDGEDDTFGTPDDERELTEEELQEQREEEEEQRKFTVQLINQQVKEVFKVLRCFKSFTAVSYEEDGAMVTRAKWQFQDIPAPE